jgi:hypothetical protein
VVPFLTKIIQTWRKKLPEKYPLRPLTVDQLKSSTACLYQLYWTEVIWNDGKIYTTNGGNEGNE